MKRSDQIFNLLLESTKTPNESGFLMPADSFERALQARLDNLLAELPVGEEMFEADLASRGIRGSSEAIGEKYRSVYAPIARAGTSAVAESMLSYNQMLQQGRITAEGFRQQGLNRMSGIYGTQLQMDNQPPWWGELLGSAIGIASLPFLMGGGGGGGAAKVTTPVM